MLLSGTGKYTLEKTGKIMYNNEWLPEGSKDFPWEKMPMGINK
jgi:hypothetical protein